jgi:hypothetical protein
MRLRSVVAAGALVFAFVAGFAAPVLAHEEINPKTFPTGQPTFFSLMAANEQSANLVKIVLHAPAGVAFGETTRSPAGWTVARTDDTITWTGGAVKPDTFDSWGYEIEGADQPGTLAYKVTLGFADGKSDDVEVDVAATAAGESGVGASGAGASSTTVTTGAATPATGAAAATAPAKGDSGDGKATAALVLSIVALLAAAGALVAAGRRRPGAGRGSAGAGERSAGGAQDW